MAFSKTEARGTFVLVLIIIVGITSSRLITYQLKDQETVAFDSTELRNWVKEVEASYSWKEQESQGIDNQSFDESSYSVPKKFNSNQEPAKPINEVLVIYDLNTINAEELRKVKGIGKVYSERIVKFRELLGGFASMDQLEEVYGIEKLLIEEIKKSISIQSPVKPIAINSDSVKALAKHPYISYDAAWAIINFRKQHGNISGFNELKEIRALNDSTLEKLRPYIFN